MRSPTCIGLVIWGWVGCVVCGCAPQFNPHQPQGEWETLTEIAQLTHGLGRAARPSFSPDMRWIIFQAPAAGEAGDQMYVARLKWKDERIVGTELPIRISPAGSGNRGGAFSPDGNCVIFASTGGGKVAPGPATRSRRTSLDGMRIYRADGWEAALAATDPSRGQDLARHPITAQGVFDAQPAYSPDGKSICFVSGRGGSEDVYVMRADGGGVTGIARGDGHNAWPDFSPDGKRIVYSRDSTGHFRIQVFVAELAVDDAGRITGMKSERRLTGNEIVNWGLRWHPDGRHILYAAGLDREVDLFVMRADGRMKAQLTFAKGIDSDPAISPDGKWLMWASQRSSGLASELYVARLKMPPGS